MKKVQKAAVSIVFAFVATMFSIIALLMTNGTLAWFSAERIVQAEGFGVKIADVNNISVTLKSYPVSKINQTTNAYTFDNSIEAYDLPTHDPNAISYLDRQKALVIELTIIAKEAQTVDIRLFASSSLDTANGIIVENASYVNNYISNCIKIRNSSLSATSNTDVIPEADSASKKHVVISNNSLVKTAEIPLLTETVPAGTSKYYFVIEYDSELLAHISKTMFNLHQDKYRVNYLNDIDFVIY